MHISTKEAIIEEAESIILAQGFNAFNFEDIAEKIGVRKTGILHYFPTKDDLGKVVIQKSRLSFLKWSKQIDMTYFEAIDKLNAFFASYHSMLEDGNKFYIAGILGAELNTLSLAMQSELRYYYLERKKWLQQLLSKGSESGSFFLSTSPEEESLYILASLQGGLQIARLNEDQEIFFSICSQLKWQLIKKSEILMQRL